MYTHVQGYKGCSPCKCPGGFYFKRDIHKYGTRNKDNFFGKAVKTRLRRDIANISGIGLWNSLPNVIRNSVTINVFKRKFKTDMIKKYMNM